MAGGTALFLGDESRESSRAERLTLWLPDRSGPFPHTHCRNTRVCGGDSKIFGSISRFASCKLPRLGAHSRGVSRFSPRSLPPMSAALAVRQHRTTAPFAAVFSLFFPGRSSSADSASPPPGAPRTPSSADARSRPAHGRARLSGRSRRGRRGSFEARRRSGSASAGAVHRLRGTHARARAHRLLRRCRPRVSSRGARRSRPRARRATRDRAASRARARSPREARARCVARRAPAPTPDARAIDRFPAPARRARAPSSAVFHPRSAALPPNATRALDSPRILAHLFTPTPVPLSFASTLRHDRASVVRGGSAPYPAPRCSPRITPPPRPPPRPISSRTRPPAAAAWAAASPTRSPSPTPPRTPR